MSHGKVTWLDLPFEDNNNLAEARVAGATCTFRGQDIDVDYMLDVAYVPLLLSDTDLSNSALLHLVLERWLVLCVPINLMHLQRKYERTALR